jgi:hypothetical protein
VPAVGEEQAGPVELAELLAEVREVFSEQLLDLAAAAQDAVVAIRELCEDGRTLEHGVLGIERHKAGKVLARDGGVPALVDVTDLGVFGGGHGRLSFRDERSQ